MVETLAAARRAATPSARCGPPPAAARAC